MTHWYKVSNLHALARWYLSGFLLLSHLILLHLITPCPKLTHVTGRGGGGVGGKRAFWSKEAKTKSEAPSESSLLLRSLSKHKDHYKSIKVCHVWNDISLCSCGMAWSVLVLDAAVAAVVAGCAVLPCQGLWGQAVPADRQRGRKPDSAAKPQSNVSLSSYLSLCLSGWLAGWLAVGCCLSACRILLWLHSIGAQLAAAESFSSPFIYFVLRAQTSSGRIKAAIYESPWLQD